LESIEGIVNGSTNYILTKTANENISYENALIDAQQKGYAESNPILAMYNSFLARELAPTPQHQPYYLTFPL